MAATQHEGTETRTPDLTPISLAELDRAEAEALAELDSAEQALEEAARELAKAPSPAVLEAARGALAWARAEPIVPRSLELELEGARYSLDVVSGVLSRFTVYGYTLDVAKLVAAAAEAR